MPEVEVIFGAIRPSRTTPAQGTKMLDILERYGVKRLDTALGYNAGGCERLLAEMHAPDRFQIDTKPLAYTPGDLRREKVLESMAKSLENLGVDSVETYIIHGPDRATPIEDTMEALQELYVAGKYKKLGISNFLLSEVEEMHSYASSKNYVLPVLYQGHYNPVARLAEGDYIDTCRRLGIRWDAYSPQAGGFFARDRHFFETPELQKGTRWDIGTPLGKMYQEMYCKPSMLNALDEWGRLSEETGISKVMLVYRWVLYHSALEKGDGMVIAVRTAEQLIEDMEGFVEGPLPQHAVNKIEEIWQSVKQDAPPVAD